MRWSCREALPWTTKTNAILTGLAGMYSTESSSHCTLLLAFPVQKQNTGHLWVYPRAARISPWLFFFLQNQSLRGSENFQGVPAHAPPRLSPPGGFHPDRAIWARGRTQKSELLLQVSCTKLCLDTHTCISKPITSKFQIAVQSICKMPKWTPPARNPSLHQTTLIPLISTVLLRGW